MSDNAKIEFTKMRLRRMTRERDDFCLRLFEEKITVKNLKMQMETLREELERLRRLTPTGTYTLTLAHEQEIRSLESEVAQALAGKIARTDAVNRLLSENGCDCECDHAVEEDHEEDCDRCLACRIDAALNGKNEP